jgi:hypothetical protein
MYDRLTARQRQFIELFFDRSSRGYLCATRAAALAGFTHPGKQGPRLTTMPHVRRLLEERFEIEARRAMAGAARARRCM